MKSRILFMTVCILFATASEGQKVLQVAYKVNGKSYNYYRTKTGGTLKGILLLFPGRGENPRDVFSRTRLPEILASDGFVTIVPDLPYSLFADNFIKAQLREIIRIQSTQTRAEKLKLALGGFSAGGAVAVSYAEHLVSVDSASNLSCVFAIDPPLDLERVYTSSEWLMKYGCTESMRSDGKQTVLYLHKVLGGSPMTTADSYSGRSPFAAKQADGGNARWLSKIPIRLYSEPDLDFVKKKFCNEIGREDLNITDLERVDKVLKASGNQGAELIITQGRGYHSWNIIDPPSLATWIAKAGN